MQFSGIGRVSCIFGRLLEGRVRELTTISKQTKVMLTCIGIEK